MGEFNEQNLANIAWAYATVGHSDEKLFAALASAAERRASEFNMRGLANTSWVFAKVCEPAPTLLEPIAVLHAIESKGTKYQAMCYQLLMECLAATGQIVAGFALLARVEASGLISDVVCGSILARLVPDHMRA